MNKEFITYEQALALKELGFDEPCFGSWEIDYCKVPTYTHSIRCFGSEFYKNSNHPKGKIAAPLYQQAFRCFREKYDLQYTITWNKHYPKCPYEWEVRKTWRDELLRPYGISGMSATYEEAEQACLNKLIEIVKQSANK